jgi:hypothetical protein
MEWIEARFAGPSAYDELPLNLILDQVPNSGAENFTAMGGFWCRKVARRISERRNIVGGARSLVWG